MECYNYSPLIYAYEAENIAITGEGVLDGQAADELPCPALETMNVPRG